MAAEETLDDVLLETEDRMDRAVSFLADELGRLRTGKGSPALVENVQVDYYGTQTRLRELATISTPEPRLIVINPYDPSSVREIEKAILAANLGVTPVADGKVIRIPIPELSEERRRELNKVVRRIAEEQRVAVRNVRRDANERIKALQREGKITEDERDHALEEIQKLTDDHIRRIDAMAREKEAEVMDMGG
ncbi:MAG TPA: ribosome recycling factor [Kiritimatiellae bacterium]|nr:ribosome recycling factor [Kiritimatiellia bacterium]